MNIIIITGGSKGIGKALVEKYASKNYKVYTLSRSINNLKNCTEISVDLSDNKATQEAFSTLLEELKSINITSVTLINNAGRLGVISNLENIAVDDISKSIQLNTTTPLILSSLFIKNLEDLNCKKQIINISSGAAMKPYEGWSVYCTSKAAIDMMTKAIAAEQNELENGVKCVAIYPGVVDTNMQTTIRSTDKKDFKNLQRFIDLKENNELYTPEYVAESIYSIDTLNKLKNGDIVDIRNF
ncbi:MULTISPECIES: (S)-benzoin forming benzil reductase [unclassified Tenacibaculum]|uniref:(S)-benzoin forming benzil reductase n=1 Tax=unclassified Tenacibaculum TaxID=2635139 RepID=UPI001F30CDA8|nr:MULTISPECIES: (S)-benzoin forming benzil reductase [unclassified Tenacibaculum]MCF2875633.1 (S)-benzoin forming benzil reductase [Tenacibaculum sp. Cn5-1]MCF2935709.1 (S)-benzoin forming benzil reductase [Tenacibaculum sp. Cn5-34]MCG7512269.1 (S)-benzoin forming benzil reductase [Tenacibaculum sp. Cn5-46]